MFFVDPEVVAMLRAIADGCDDVVITPEPFTNLWTVRVHLSRGESEVVVEVLRDDESLKLSRSGWTLSPKARIVTTTPR